MNRVIAAVASFAWELVVFYAALILAVAGEACGPFWGLPRGVAAVYIALGLSFFAAGFVRFPWPRRVWLVGAASMVIALVVLGQLVWNYQTGIMRQNPRAWLFRLEYLWSGQNIIRAAIGVVGALGGFLSAEGVAHMLRRPAPRPHENEAVEHGVEADKAPSRR